MTNVIQRLNNGVLTSNVLKKRFFYKKKKLKKLILLFLGTKPHHSLVFEPGQVRQLLP